jgi:hypothetical protein
MRNCLCALAILFLSDMNAAAADPMGIRQLGNGWIGLTKQSDPFDNSKVQVFQISKESFTFRCGELNMEAASYGFEGLSFDADLKYMIDDRAPVDKSGRYSTYLGGSDMITDSRYFSFSLNDADLEMIKAGSTMKVAGKYSNTGWQTKSVSLLGFTSAYSQMCR